MGTVIKEFVFDDEVYTIQQVEQLKDFAKLPSYKDFNILEKWAEENTNENSLSIMVINLNTNSITIDFNIKNMNEFVTAQISA